MIHSEPLSKDGSDSNNNGKGSFGSDIERYAGLLGHNMPDSTVASVDTSIDKSFLSYTHIPSENGIHFSNRGPILLQNGYVCN